MRTCFLAFVLVGCGGSIDPTTIDPTDAAVDAPEVSDVGDGGREALPVGPAFGATGGCASSCPVTIPASGAPCALPSGAECEYGPAFDPRCNTLARCTGGVFAVHGPTATCPTPAPATTCPSSPFGPERGRPCPEPGVICTYVDGVCGCQPGSGGGAWVCATFTCRGPRARVGCNCAGSLACGHGGCDSATLLHGIDLRCVGGVVQRADACQP